MNWEKRRAAVVRCRELVTRIDFYVPKLPKKFAEELQNVGRSMARMIQLYEELDDCRTELESQCAELRALQSATVDKAPKPKREKKPKEPPSETAAGS